MNRVYPGSTDFTSAHVNNVWTANDGNEVASVYFGNGHTYATVDDVESALSVADAFQDAARQLRLRQLAAHRREAVSA